jgi:hypothetical protein
VNGTLESTKGTARPDSAAELSVGTAIAMVDDALSKIGRRELVTAREASDLVRDVRGAVVSAAAAALLDSLLAECETDSLVSSARLADAFLDVRLALTAEAIADVAWIAP